MSARLGHADPSITQRSAPTQGALIGGLLSAATAAVVGAVLARRSRE